MKNLNKILILITTFFLLSCASKVSSQAHTFAFLLKFLIGDKISPTISFTSPAAIDDEFETDKSFTVVFSEPVAASSVSPLRLSLNGVDAEGSADFLDNTLIFTPSSPLAANTKYLVNISGVEDKSGNPLASEYKYSFKTGNGIDTTPLSINATSPVSDASNVELNAKIAIEFNETLNPKSILPEVLSANFILKTNGVNVEYTCEYLGNILYIKPTQDLSAYTYYTLTIDGGVTDTSNLPMGSDYSINFLTANAKDVTPPSVTQTFPEQKASAALRSGLGGDILLNTVKGKEIQPAQMVMVDFSEAIINALPDSNIFVINAETKEKVNFGVRRGLSSITVFPLSSNNKWELGGVYILAILPSVTDLATNTLPDESYNLVFPVASVETPSVPPVISLQAPINAETNVTLKTNVRMTFSKPIFRPSASIDSIYVEDNLGNKVTGTFSYIDNFTVVFTPFTLLSPNTTYTGYVIKNIRDIENTKLADTHTYTFTTEALVAPTSLSYSKEYYLFTTNEAIVPMIPTTAGNITACNASPSLPAGLFLLPRCTIYGTPKATLNTTEFTITASNDFGSINTKIFLNVIKPGGQPFFFSYPLNSYSFVRNTAIAPVKPNTIGSLLSCSSSPALPSGLNLASDCKISGTPTASSAETTYSITGSSGTTAITRNLSISVTANTLNYPLSSYALIKNVLITITPVIDASTYNCYITPTLPTGMSIDSKNCTISGVPTVTQSNTNYTITAQNNSGTATTGLTLSVRLVNSCKEILDHGLSSGDGVYQIDVDGLGGQDPLRTYCDMTTSGGGWTLGFIKNSMQSGSYPGFASNYTNLSHLEFDPAIASTLTLPLAGWLNANELTYTNLRFASYSDGTRTFLSVDIPRTSLRINFGQSGYLLYNATSEGYYWCGGIRDFTDYGTYEDNPVSGTTVTRNCKGHWAVGTGWDFSKTNTLNQGFTLCSVEAGYNFMYRSLGAGLIYYGGAGAAYALWFR